MKKNTSIAIAVMFALLGGFGSASAQTDTTTAGVAPSTSTTNVTGIVTTGTSATVVPQKPEVRTTETRIQMEAREKALREKAANQRQTQSTSFGDKVRTGASIGDPDFDLLRKAQMDMRVETTGERKDMRVEMSENRIKMEMRAKELNASSSKQHGKIKDEAQKKRLEQARKQVEIVDERIKKAIERVQKLHDRVAERLIKLEANGIDVAPSRAHLEMAKAELDKAHVKAAGVGLTIEMAFASITTSITAPTSTTPAQATQNAMKTVQEAVKDVSESIKEAHKHVALAVSSIKPGINKGKSATTSPAVTGAINATTTQ